MSDRFSEAWCYDMLRQVRWRRGVMCPLCGATRVTTHSKSATTPRRRYVCLACRRTFTDLTGTPLARTNLPLTKWFVCLELISHPQTPTELAKTLAVKWDTAARLHRRLVVALARPGLVRELRDAVEKTNGS